MAVTPVGNPYVESSDLVANYPGASEALAERLDVVGVNPFADSAARATAIPSPVEGQMASLNDDDKVYRYSGSEWLVVGPPLSSAVARVETSQSGNSGVYADPATAGPAVTLTTGTKALVTITASLNDNNGNPLYASFVVSGASTVAASDANAIYAYGINMRATASTLLTGLTAGSNTFTMKYRVNVGSGLVANREISVIDMGS